MPPTKKIPPSKKTGSVSRNPRTQVAAVEDSDKTRCENSGGTWDSKKKVCICTSPFKQSKGGKTCYFEALPNNNLAGIAFQPRGFPCIGPWDEKSKFILVPPTKELLTEMLKKFK